MKTLSQIACLLIGLRLIESAFGLDVETRLMTNGYATGRPPGTKIDTMMLHFSSNVVANKKNPHDVDAVIKIFSAANASAHYLIDRAGKIYRLVKESDTAYHAGAGVWQGRTNTLNRFSIGIEILGIGTFEEMKKMLNLSKAEYDSIPKEHLGFTQAQYTSLKGLIADVRGRNPAILADRKHIIGHSEYAPERKVDPGSLFDWHAIGH